MGTNMMNATPRLPKAVHRMWSSPAFRKHRLVVGRHERDVVCRLEKRTGATSYREIKKFYGWPTGWSVARWVVPNAIGKGMLRVSRDTSTARRREQSYEVTPMGKRVAELPDDFRFLTVNAMIFIGMTMIYGSPAECCTNAKAEFEESTIPPYFLKPGGIYGYRNTLARKGLFFGASTTWEPTPVANDVYNSLLAVLEARDHQA